jgi:hypothetical protein
MTFERKDIDKTCQQTTNTKVGSQNRMVTSFPVCPTPSYTETTSGQILKNQQTTLGRNREEIDTKNNDFKSSSRMVRLLPLGNVAWQSFALPVSFTPSKRANSSTMMTHKECPQNTNSKPWSVYQMAIPLPLAGAT